jgi:hypothetical protein
VSGLPRQIPEVLHVVEYRGAFGFIKPWTAVRDGTTYSQTFLTPSIIEGLRQKLEVNAILRHRVRHHGIGLQQERTQSADWKIDGKQASRPLSIIIRGVMVQPTLWLAFATAGEAATAATQHICLCRNEDVLLPTGIDEMTVEAFNSLAGIELRFGDGPGAFLVGFNRFEGAAPMYGHLVVVDSPLDGGGNR